ncbi:MAG: hypothetical protein IBX36_00420 [Dehalococcoidia bacterium]|nr:hypothetical protein [Dehalococcoidia bacterium]
MEIPGYAGSILYVDLTSGQIRKEPLDPEMVRALIGGWGINNRLAYDLIPPDADPLSPENAILIGTGPFSGTIVPGSAELLVTSKFPLNGSFATACGGGNFALMLKTSGYDHVVISGRAEKPVYLKILDDDVELCDAGGLWGRDTFETVDELRERYDPCSVIPIGQAGENLVKVSVTAIDKGGTLGSGGLPAVMGSKRLKAIVAVQGTRGVRVAHRLKLRKVVDEMLDSIMNYRLRPTLIQGGLLAMTASWTAVTAKISQNYTEISFAPGHDVREIHNRVRKPIACASCPMADKELNRLSEGPFAGMTTYMTHFGFSGQGGESALEEHNRSVRFRDAANRYGICLFCFGVVKDLMAYLYEQGIITKEDTGGIELVDDFDTNMKLLEMTAYREGFGDVLAEGILGAARRVGKGAEDHAVHIKGYYLLGDPRITGLGTPDIAQIVHPARSGGCAGIAGSLGSASYNPGRPIEQWVREAEKIGIPGDAMERAFTTTSFNPGRLTKYTEDWYSLSNCLGRCHRLYINRFFTVRNIAELYSAVTGVETTPAELYKVAERAWNLFKVLNVRAGFERKDDRPPKVWFTPLKGEGTEFPLMDYYKTTVLTEADVDRILDDYYEERGWDKKTGTPTPPKLRELGLEEL